MCPEAGPGTGDPGAGAAAGAGEVDPVTGCVTQTALADTGVEGRSSSVGLAVLGLGALFAGAAALSLSLRSRGNHG